jgi:hypothetical protein
LVLFVGSNIVASRDGGKMNSSTEFVVGEKYENEKGVFTVVSIEKGEMLIQWANGEEAQTSMEFQDRIQKRRHWEKTRQMEKMDAVKPPPKKTRASKSSKREPSE